MVHVDCNLMCSARLFMTHSHDSHQVALKRVSFDKQTNWKSSAYKRQDVQLLSVQD